MSAQLDWDKDGIQVLGHVDVQTGNSFFEFPLRAANLKFLQRTTSIAGLVFSTCHIKYGD